MRSSKPSGENSMELKEQQDFRDLPLEIQYCGYGELILRGFIKPVLNLSVQYDRITSFFTTHSLLAIADGIESLRQRKGRMRLILGIHDVPRELAHAACSNDEYISSLIQKVEEKIFVQAGSIKDELIKDRLAAVAWMMKDGLLEVRVAAPLSVSGTGTGIVHNKSFVFRDNKGNIVAAVGSPNETVAGLGDNYEEINVFMSWKGSSEYTQKQVEKFESFWNSRQPGLIVRALDIEFADKLLRALGKAPRIEDSGELRRTDLLGRVLDAAINMPLYSLVSGRYCALYPHQERAYMEALNRWPMRIMFADEVGLGKTIEAAAVIEHAIKFRHISRILILVPKGVISQWQEELYHLFGLKFWIYDSGTKTYYDILGRVIEKGRGPVLSAESPELLLISAQFARGRKGQSPIFEDATVLPEMLVVDEAQSARLRPDISGKLDPTRMWRMLKEVAKKIPHLILLTATPMQIYWQEYHALLALMGLPGKWERPSYYERSLKIIASQDAPSLDDSHTLLALLVDSAKIMKPSTELLSSDERALLDSILASSSSVTAAILVQKSWSTALSLFIKFHPAHLLTIRNTRGVLSDLGYKFPERVLLAPQLDITDNIRKIYQAVEAYLSKGYFSVERAIYPERTFNAGFVLCMYQQRLASSLRACQLSLQRRRNRLEALCRGEVVPLEMDEGIDEEPEVEELVGLFERLGVRSSRISKEEVKRAINIETAYIDDILRRLDLQLPSFRDPKLEKLIQVLEDHLSQGDRILVFSRYTDTLDAAVEEFRSRIISSDGYAYYSGKESWIALNNDVQPASRATVKDALKSGNVKIVFCSDAASEGLNLQSARVIINIDVPWNPARLEQRIGRIARLGQSSDVVTIYNLWYPDSVEAKIYTRLIQRKELYDLAVGQFPEIVSQAIREEISSRLIPTEFGVRIVSDPLQKLQDLRKEIQLTSLNKIWRIGLSTTPLTGELRQRLLRLIAAIVECERTPAGQLKCKFPHIAIMVSDAPGDPDCISLSHPAMRSLPAAQNSGSTIELGYLEGNEVPTAFALKDSEGSIRIIRQEALASLIEFLVNGSPLSAESSTIRLGSADDLPFEPERIVFGKFSWMPGADELNIPYEEGRAPLPPSLGSLVFRSIASIKSGG